MHVDDNALDLNRLAHAMAGPIIDTGIGERGKITCERRQGRSARRGVNLLWVLSLVWCKQRLMA